MVDYTRIPASIIRTGFPKIVDLAEGEPRPELPEEVKRLSRLVDYLFTKTPEGEAKDHDCLIEGWNGEYISAAQGWKKGLDLDSIVSSYGGEIVIPSFPVCVSDDFASAHSNISKYCDHKNNPISSMGAYIVTFVEGPDRSLSVLVDKRPGNAALYPGKFNATGAAIPADGKEDYVKAVTGRVNKKYSLNIDAEKVRPLGILFDNVYNITIPSGYVIIHQDCVGDDTKLMKIPVSEFEAFVSKEAPLSAWNYPGFLGICEGIIRLQDEFSGKSGIDYGALGARLMEKEYAKLQTNPLRVQSVLQSVEQELISEGKSLIDFFSRLVDI